MITIRAILLQGILCMPAFNAGLAHAAAQTPGEDDLHGGTRMELAEVEVIGRKLHQMQREVIEAEDRFYALYNELNQNRDFDIHCVVEARTGTKVRQRDCRIEFVQRAVTMQAQEFLYGGTSASPGFWRPVSDPGAEWFVRREEYRENARALLLAHPQLMERALKWRQLQAQYERARKQRMKGRVILVE